MRQNGFTLVELISVIVILGIITVTVGPRFVGRSGFAEYALRDQIISIFRFAQQRAMYDHSGSCYRVVIDGTVSSGTIQAQRDTVSINNEYNLGLNDDYEGLGVDNQTIYFDGLGNTYLGACPPATAAALLTDEITINITGGELLSFSVHPTGYVERL